MNNTKTLLVEVITEIKASADKVWHALTDKDIVKQYFFGTELDTDWKKGSPIYFRGSWEGKSYEDKGIILDIIPGKKLVYNYWSSMSGTEDKPENYATITYELKEKDSSTMVTILQDGIENEEKKKHSENNWKFIMGEMKKLVEKTHP